MPFYALGDAKPELPPAGEHWVAPNAVLVGRVRLLRNASVWFGVTARGDNEWITIGENANVQDNSVLHSDPGIAVDIGAYVTVGHSVIVHSASIGENSLIGMGSILLTGCKVGKNCLIGANTLIPERKEIPDNSLVVGSPGRIVRKIGGEEIALLKFSAEHYVENWKRFRAELSAIS